MSESKYNQAYTEGIKKGIELAHIEMTMNCIEQDLIPLSVIEDIKAEIDNSKLDYPIVDEVLAIIDKHISGKEK